MHIYVAASFAYEDRDKTEQRKSIIESVVREISNKLDNKCSFYLPHKLKIENAWDISLEEWAGKVFEADVKELTSCDLVLFLSFGKENNAGSAWEVGYAYALNKKIITVKLSNLPESLMIANSSYAIIDNIDEYDWKTMPAFKSKLYKLS